MIIFPTLQILNGSCVTLEHGCLDEPVIWHVDPIKYAREFAAAGAEWMHVTDLNAVQGDFSQTELIQDVIRAAGIPVQLGGGMRSRDHIADWIDRGAGRIVLGTLAEQDPAMVTELAKHYPDQIVVSVDIWQGKVMTDGWRNSGAWEPLDLLKEFDKLPLAGIVVTDIDNDITAVEEPLGMITGIARELSVPVLASGVVRSLDDISRLKYVYNIAGVLVGSALMRQTFTVEDALVTAQPEPEPVASFQ